jgi:hypothetical protein
MNGDAPSVRTGIRPKGKTAQQPAKGIAMKEETTHNCEGGRGNRIASSIRGAFLNAFYNGMPGHKAIAKVSRNLADKLGWAHNHSYIRNVMKRGGIIYDLGGEKTRTYAKELKLLRKYPLLIKL